MKKTSLFLVLGAAISAVSCTHNYYYGTVYTSPGSQSTHIDHTYGNPGTYSGSGNTGSGNSGGSNSGNSGSTAGSGTHVDTPRPTGNAPQADPPGRPTTSAPQADPPGRPGSTTNPGNTATGGTPDSNPGSGNSTNTATLPQQISTRQLFRTWMHSHEEDREGVQVYRPSTYNFPPARGREGYTFESNGKVIQHGIAAADGTENNTGTWTLRNRTLNISGIKEQRPYQLEIVSLDDKVLKVKRR